MDTRDRFVDAAIDLLREGGYARAGINEIVASSGAPKGSLYHHFPGGKQQIVREALAAYGRAVSAYADDVLTRAGTPAERVRALFAVVARRLETSGFRRSCAAGAVALDLDADLESVREAVRAFFDAWVEQVAPQLPLGDRARQASFAGLLLTAIEGGYVRGRAEHSTRALLEAGEWLALLIEKSATSPSPSPARTRAPSGPPAGTTPPSKTRRRSPR
jgi:TetR/AcrR family transcriptional repressor of lmrAB and yxaGH operons